MRVLVVNSGSSSLKLRVLGSEDEVVFSRDLPAMGRDGDTDDLADALSEVEEVDAVGHRIVHGGERFTQSVRIDDDVARELRGSIGLAPLHQPKSLAALEAVSRTFPALPAVACFDTTFHATLPAEAATYALPVEWRERFGIRRYGFHGLSHAYAARRALQMTGASGDGSRVVTCHLGAGASLTAVSDGRSVDTTMGFTALEGLVMATRSGSIDPGIVLWLQRDAGLSVDEVAEGLERRSGLKGLAGSSDMRAILASVESGDDSARLAVDVYVHRLCGWIAAMAASLGGIDVLVFTGGVGENAWPIRERAVERLAFLGIHIDPDLNRKATSDTDISSPGAAAKCLVVASREDIEIAREVREVLAPRPDLRPDDHVR